MIAITGRYHSLRFAISNYITRTHDYREYNYLNTEINKYSLLIPRRNPVMQYDIHLIRALLKDHNDELIIAKIRDNFGWDPSIEKLNISTRIKFFKGNTEDFYSNLEREIIPQLEKRSIESKIKYCLFWLNLFIHK